MGQGFDEYQNESVLLAIQLIDWAVKMGWFVEKEERNKNQPLICWMFVISRENIFSECIETFYFNENNITVEFNLKLNLQQFISSKTE